MTIEEFKNKFNEIYKDKFKFLWTYGKKGNQIEMFIYSLNNCQYFKLISCKNENNFIDKKDFEMLCNTLINLFEGSDKNE